MSDHSCNNSFIDGIALSAKYFLAQTIKLEAFHCMMMKKIQIKQHKTNQKQT